MSCCHCDHLPLRSTVSDEHYSCLFSGCLYPEKHLFIYSVSTSKAARIWIVVPLTALSLLPFIGSLQLFQHSQFCSQTSFSNLSLLCFKHIGISLYAFSTPPLPLFPLPICSLQSLFTSLPHFSLLAVTSDALSLAFIHNLRLGLVQKPESIEIVAGYL